MINWSDVQNFKAHEFDSPDRPNTGGLMNPLLVYRLDALRLLVDRPMVINSGYRTKEHNARIKGAPKSAHLEGLAVDIGTHGWPSVDRANLISYARKLGFTGIGVASNFIHLDMKPRKAAWAYTTKGHMPLAIGEEVEHA